jgi:FolB domain-containing protein
MPCRIEIAEMRLMIPIGCKEEERKQAQPIHVRATLSSDAPFEACRTDQLSDTLDAGELKATIAERATRARVRTLERLGQLLEDTFRERFKAPGLQWEITLVKPNYGWSYVHSWTS